ncbi:hypothetical protein [Azoarcus sp. KH32C]|uniref:hypothetical protein n=1 Tax=Azoarcus sp. KH32C TaxID=748247 RepID=UPI0002385C6D|nr:hypothetical protein [Azoarcus sp. KH32C]BAL27420.1 hypothetical protein AZKH_p0537 [Azoarcus sp. KH32C]
MSRLLLRLASPLFALLMATPAGAAVLTCNGTINQVRLVTDGSLQVLPSWRGDWVNLCNINTIWKSIPLEVCKRLHASALTAQATQGTTSTYYASATATSCGTMATGTTADAPTSFTNQ